MKLSIITVNLNNAAGLRNTIESVLKQTYTDFEYLIIDGASNDQSVEVIQQFGDRIHYWISEPDKGLYDAMNKGIEHANGEYLQFLNSGDEIAEATTLESVFTKEGQADIVYGDVLVISGDGSAKRMVPLHDDRLTLAHFYTNTEMTIGHGASFVRKSLFTKSMYDLNYKILADVKFFIERMILDSCSVQYIPVVILHFYLDGMSSNPRNWDRTITEREKIFEELLPPGLFKDYKLLLEVKDSPLLVYLPMLQNTSGLKKLILLFLRSAIGLHKLFRK